MMMTRILKIFGWTVMALLLLVAGSLIVAVRLLHPDRLTPLACAAANRYLDADVTLRRAELDLSGAFPFLQVTLDDLTVASRAIRRLPASERASLPAYADTLISFRRMQGSINLARLAAGEVILGDVTFTAPCINLVTVNDNLNNFDIVPPSEPSEPSPLPKIAIRRFAIVDPGPIRYYSHADRSLTELDLSSMIIDGEEQPRYMCDLRGAMPLGDMDMELLGSLPFTLTGDVLWDPAAPQTLGLENLTFEVAMLGGRLDTHVDFGEELVVKDLKLKLDPLPLEEIAGMIPAGTMKSLGLPDDFATTVAPEIEVALDRPFNTVTDSIPYATLRLNMPPGTVTYMGTTFRNLSADVTARLFGPDLDKATVTVDRFTVNAPATEVSLKGSVTNLMSDPLFEGDLDADTDLRKLPPFLTDILRGYISGHLTACLKIKGRPSMFAPGSYYKLNVAGDIEGRRLYWLGADTANMAYANHCRIHFGNDKSFRNDNRERAQLLSARIEIDSVNVLHTEYSFKATDLKLGLATKNQRPSADTTAVFPLGGGLKTGSFDFRLLSDSIMVRARDIDGRVAMRATDGDVHRPSFDFNLNIRRLATGDPNTRFMLSGADVNFSAMKLPGRKPPKEVTDMADSIKVARPDLPMDSVYALAIEKYRHKKRGGIPRVHAQITDNDDEIIEWGTSKALRRLLLQWKVSGHILSDRVSLFTPYFPMRNRIRNFNIRFNNDSINLDNIEYKVGHSDFLLSGRISNLRRGLTSRSHRQSVKANFDLISDTIDINQLADLTFRGAAYAENKDKQSLHLDKIDSDDTLDHEIDRYVAGTSDSVAPLLIPRNFEAVINVKANNILYSDLILHRLGGTALIYDGALNLHDLRASSDIGSVNLSALYSAPNIHDLNFGFGLNVERFDIHGFLGLVPAIDSVMPLIRDLNGIIDADIAATVKLHRNMDLDMNSLHAAVNISGDSLQLIDAETYRKIGKWLLFKNKQDNIIKHMSVEMIVDSSMMEIYPFVFDIDRYRLGVQGYNDLDMNFNYHIAVLKSPLPFKFGINLKGTPEDYKIRLGGSRFNEKQAINRKPIADTTRVNLIRQIENVFRRGVDNSRFSRLNINARPTAAEIDLSTDTLTRADSVRLIREGLIPAPPGFLESAQPDNNSKKKNKNKKKKTDGRQAAISKYDRTQESIFQLYSALPPERRTTGRPVRHGRHSV